MSASDRYRLFIFDFDGTLADSFPSFLRHMHQVAEHFGLRKLDAEELDHLRGLGAAEILKALEIPLWKMPLLVRYMRRLMAADVSSTRLFPGVPMLLRQLKKRGALVAIVSSNSKENVQAILGPENVQRIDLFECGASLFGKASKFRKVLRKTGVPAAVAVAIGDEIRDLDAARESGIPFGAVSWGYTKVAALRARAPQHVFVEPEQILRLTAGS